MKLQRSVSQLWTATILGGRNGVPHRSATTTVLLRQGDRAHATEIGWLDIALAET